MTHLFLAFVLVAASALAACSPAAPPAPRPDPVDAAERHPADPALAGRWGGVLETGSQQLRLEIDVTLDGAAPQVVLTSVNQGGARFPMETVRIDGPALHFATAGLGLQYDGMLAGGRIEGVFNQGGLSLPLVLERLAAAPQPAMSAPPANPRERTITVDIPEGRLAGVLTVPEEVRAGIVIVSGSGPQDRDGTMAGQAVYSRLAQALADAGVASLRLDDRGVGESEGPVPQHPDDLAGDAAVALDALRDETGLTCTGSVGHSEGALLALLAAPDAGPDFIVSLAGMHLDMRTTLLSQSEAIIRASGGGEAQVIANQRLQEAVFAAIETAPPGESAQAITAALTEAGAPSTVAAREGAVWGQPYAVASFAIDPAAAAAGYDGPMLAVFGGRDLQVLADPASTALREARAGLDTQIVVIDSANHLFQDSQTGLPQDYATAGPAPSQTALDQISAALDGLLVTACPAD